MKGIEVVRSLEECQDVLQLFAVNMCLGILYKEIAKPKDLLEPRVYAYGRRSIPEKVWELAYLTQSVLPSQLQVPRQRFTFRLEDFYDSWFSIWHYDGTNDFEGPTVQFVEKGSMCVELARADHLLDDSLGDIDYDSLTEDWMTAYDCEQLDEGDALIFQSYFNPAAALMAVHHRFSSEGSRHSIGLFGPRDINEYQPGPVNWE